MSLDPEIAALRAAAAALGAPPLSEISPAEARARTTAGDAAGAAPAPVARVTDALVPRTVADGGPIPVRVYEDGPCALSLVYAHGGGWVTGDLNTADGFCRDIAAAGPVRVVSVDYRLAPECPYPAGLDDVRAALRWARDEYGDPVALGGDSAGANLAAVSTGDRPGEIEALVLLYPVTDATLSGESYRDPEARFPIGEAEMRWFRDHYVPAGLDHRDPALSPGLHPIPAGHPRTYVLTAQHDPLRDEGQAYAAALREAGVTVVAEHADTLPHGFLRLAGRSQTADEWRRRVTASVLGVLGV